MNFRFKILDLRFEILDLRFTIVSLLVLFSVMGFAQSNLTYELKVGSTGENGLLAAFPESYAGEKVNISLRPLTLLDRPPDC